jgi:hypothetical protein
MHIHKSGRVVLARSNNAVVGSNPTPGSNSVFVVLRVGSGLATG